MGTQNAQKDTDFAPRIYTYLHGKCSRKDAKGRGDLWAHGMHGRTQNFVLTEGHKDIFYKF
jgi:hypothetical protein